MKFRKWRAGDDNQPIKRKTPPANWIIGGKKSQGSNLQDQLAQRAIIQLGMGGNPHHSPFVGTCPTYGGRFCFRV
jgi:hypothetical protein